MGLFKTQGVYSASVTWQSSNVKLLCSRQQLIYLFSSSKLPTFTFHWAFWGHLNKQAETRGELSNWQFRCRCGDSYSVTPCFLGFHPRFLVTLEALRSQPLTAQNGVFSGFYLPYCAHEKGLYRCGTHLACMVPASKAWESLHLLPFLLWFFKELGRFCLEMIIVSYGRIIVVLTVLTFSAPELAGLLYQQTLCFSSSPNLQPSFFPEVLLYFTSLLKDKRPA